MRLRTIALAAALSLPSLAAHADNIQTIGEFNGNGSYSDPGPYQPSVTVGTFTILSGDSALTISGTFGNSQVGSSAGVDVYLGSILVGQCVENAACYNTGALWSDILTASQIASLGTGSVNLTAVQTSQFTIRLGVTTLDQVTGSSITPEPSSIALLGTGLLTFVGAMRKRYA